MILSFTDFISDSNIVKLFEGGNASAFMSDGTKVGDAQKIDLSVFNRTEMVKDMLIFFEQFNKDFKKATGENIWNDTSILKSGLAFNGSAEHFFNIEQISDEDFLKVKRFVGDLDVTVPKTYLLAIFEFLKTIEGKKITPNVKYLGNNKLNTLGAKDQINCVFEYTDSKGNKVNFQVDFEGTDYGTDFKPSMFAKFGHSSSWEDMQHHLKGVNHKFMLINLVRAISMQPNAVVITPSSPKDPKDPKFRITVASTREIPRNLAFFISRGLRMKLRQEFYDDGTPIMYKDKYVFSEIPASESKYETSLEEIFKIIFGSTPTSSDLSDFWSFMGMIRLMKKYLTKSKIEDAFNFLVNTSLFGPGAQGLERNNPELDFQIKYAMVNKLYEEFPYLKNKFHDSVLKMSDTYYKNYKR